MIDVDNEYAGRTARLGPAISHEPMPSDELDYCNGRLPPRLVRFLEDMGQATFLNNGMTIAKPSTLAPILALVFKADPDLSHRNCTVVSYSAFGDLSLWSNRLPFVNISLAEGSISSRALAPTKFRAGLMPPGPIRDPDPNLVARAAVICDPDSFDFLDNRRYEMLARCIAMHGPIALGECYGFLPALALAGIESPMRRVEYIRRVPALEHFAFLAQAQSFYLTKVGPTSIEKVRQIG